MTARGLSLIKAKVAEWSALVAEAPDDEARKPARRDLAYWNTRLSTARVAQPPVAGVVGIGSSVVFRLKGSVRTIEIVGHDEAEPVRGRIAFNAPLAKAMIGAGQGDWVDFGGVDESIEVLEVS